MSNTSNNNTQVNIVDIFFYLLRNWYWFLLCIGIAVGYAYYKYTQLPFVYRSDARVIIKDPSSTHTGSSLVTYSNMINKVNMTNEILQLKSKTLMSEVVKALDADVNYSYRERLRDVELYRRTPVRLFFSREDETFTSMSAKIVPLDNNTIRFEPSDGPAQSVVLGDTVAYNGHQLVFKPTSSYSPYYFKKEIIIRKVPVLSAANSFIARLSVGQGDGAILNLFIQDYSAQRATDILNTLIEKYNEDAIREKNQSAINTASFINERLLIIQAELGDVETDLARYQSAQGTMNISNAANEYLAQSRNFNNEIIKIETRINLAEYLKDYLSNSFVSYDMIPVNTGLDDPRIDNRIAEYNEQINRRARLVDQSSVDSPAVKEVEANLNTIRQNILGYIDNLVLSLNMRKEDYAEKEKESMQNFTAMPAKARQMLSIERQQKIKESLYLYLLNKREENALAQSMVDNNARMIDTAISSGSPIYPNRNRMLLLAFLIGLAIPAVILLSMLFIDTRVKTRKDVENAISVPFLAEVPFKKLKKKELKEIKNGVYYDPNSKGIFTESMRLMTTNLEFMKPEGVDHAVVATTSFSVSAGKTFIDTNLAACLADAQKKVIIIDCDLRKRTISKQFGLKHKTSGLSNFLFDDAMSISSIIRPNIIEGVDFIPAGHVPPNPTELLSRKRFDTLVEDLKAVYDYIILDSVPVNVVADPYVINRVTDMNLFVLRSGQVDKRILPELDNLYESGKLNNLAIILNGSVVRKTYGAYGYGYGYGYGYSYGYGYGYGEDEKS